MSLFLIGNSLLDNLIFVFGNVPSLSKLFLFIFILLSLSGLQNALFCCSNAFKKFFYRVLEEMTDRRSSTAKQFTIDVCLENFQRLLYKSADDKIRTDNFLLKLQEELEALRVQVTKHFSVQRTEVNFLILLDNSVRLDFQLKA